MGLFSSIGKVFKGIAGGIFGSNPKIKYPKPQETILPRDKYLQEFYTNVFSPNVLGISSSGSVMPSFLGDFQIAPEEYKKAAEDYGIMSLLNADTISNLLPRPPFFKYQTPFNKSVPWATGFDEIITDSLHYLPSGSFFSIPDITITTPFGTIPAFGLQYSALKPRMMYMNLLNAQQGLIGNMLSNLLKPRLSYLDATSTIGKQLGLINAFTEAGLLKPAEIKYNIDYLTPIQNFMAQDLARYKVQVVPYVTAGSPGLLGYALAAMGKPLGQWAWGKIHDWLGG